MYYYSLNYEPMNVPNVLTKCVKSIVRYVYGLGRYKSTENYVVRFLGCSLDTFLKVRSMCFLYNPDCSSKSTYLKDLIFRCQSSRSVQLNMPSFELAVGKKSPYVQGIIHWNSIPVRTRMVNSRKVFQKRCNIEIILHDHRIGIL